MISLLSLVIGFQASLALAGPSNCASKGHNNPTATIDSGPLLGTVTSVPGAEISVNKYLGIPFAKPPPRFGPPEPIPSWGSTIFNATEVGPACIQSFKGNETQREWSKSWANSPPPPGGEDEDCLTVNVWTPATKSKILKPVLVWMYGGSFQNGAGSLPAYDGANFAANQDVLLVTFNYRTNIFGFPAAKEFSDEEVNLGFLDSRLALDWVHRNIAAFGGDPEKVTLFGQSAGAGIVDTLILAPPDPLPFRAAILQSGTATFISAAINKRGEAWKALLKLVNCPEGDGEVECVRKIPAFELRDKVQTLNGYVFDAAPGVPTWPADGRQRRLNSTKNSSSIARVPVLVGSNDDEGEGFVRWSQTSAKDYVKGLSASVTDEMAEKVLAMYPISSEIPNDHERMSKIEGELSFNAPAFGYANESAHVGIPTWQYYFNLTSPDPKIYEGSGAYHSSEIRYLFGTYSHNTTKEYQEVGRAMQKAWADFAKDPTKGPGWEQYPTVGVFGYYKEEKKPFMAKKLEELAKRCAFWLNLMAPLK